MTELVVFRGIQGIGAGGLFPLSLAVIGNIVPPRDRGRWQGLIGAVVRGRRRSSGPRSAASSSTTTSWRWVFFVNLPVGGARARRDLADDAAPRAARREHSIDWLGAGVLAAGTGVAAARARLGRAAVRRGRAAHVLGRAGRLGRRCSSRSRSSSGARPSRSCRSTSAQPDRRRRASPAWRSSGWRCSGRSPTSRSSCRA